VLLAVGWLSARLLPGEDSPLVLEIPPIRRPLLKNLATKTLARVEWYLREAVPLFLLATFLLFLADRSGVLGFLEIAFRPLVTGVLGLPVEATAAFLVGFLRRDYGAIFLLDAARQGHLDAGQALIAAVVVTLFVPCVANLFLIGREWGWRIAVAILGAVIGVAITVGGLMNLVLGLTGWTP
jgi:ferrous iron transport protein B